MVALILNCLQRTNAWDNIVYNEQQQCVQHTRARCLLSDCQIWHKSAISFQFSYELNFIQLIKQKWAGDYTSNRSFFRNFRIESYVHVIFFGFNGKLWLWPCCSDQPYGCFVCVAHPSHSTKNIRIKLISRICLMVITIIPL